MISVRNLEGWFVATRSRVLIPPVSSSTLCMKPLTSDISVNVWWIDGYGVLGFCLLFFKSQPGKFKSPATTIKAFFMVDALPRPLANWSMHSSLEVLGW